MRNAALAIWPLLCLTESARAHISELIPNTTTAGGPAFTLVVRGEDLLPNEVLSWNGVTLQSMHISAFEKRVAIPASLISRALFPNGGSVNIELVGFAGSLRFTINPPLAIATPAELPQAVVGTPYRQTLQRTGGTAPFLWSGMPPPGLTLSQDGVLSGTFTSAATMGFTAQVRDAATVTASRDFSIVVRAANTAPTATDDAYAVALRQTPLTTMHPAQRLTIPAPGVLRNDRDPESSPITAILESGVANGTLTLNADGSFTYVSNAGFVGEDSFRYRVSDGSLRSAPATVRIVVLATATASCGVAPRNAIVYTAGATLEFPMEARVLVGGVPLVSTPVNVNNGKGTSPVTDSQGIARFRVFLADVNEVEQRVTVSVTNEFETVTFACSAEVKVAESMFAPVLFFCFVIFGPRAAYPEGPEGDDLLPTFRRFRDKVLERSPAGREYASLYYRYRTQLARILVSHPGLLWRYRNKVREHLRLAEALIRGDSVHVRPTELAELQILLSTLEGYADGELRGHLARLRRDLANPRFLAAFGVNISPEQTRAKLGEAYSKVPLHFEPNVGQAGIETQYVARGAGYFIYLRPQEASLRLAGDDSPIRMRLFGGNAASRPTALQPLQGASHYLIGPNPNDWRTGVRQYGKVRYDNVYPGVDLVYYGRQNQLEYDFVVRPGASPDRVALDFDGVDAVDIASNGDLVLRRGNGGEVRLLRPDLYQEIDGRRSSIEGRYVRKGRKRIGFQVARYDAKRPLIIDPVLSYAGYLGGAGLEASMSLAVDSAGNAYVTGGTTSADFAVRGGSQARYAGGGRFGADAFVTKFDPSGAALIYSTYLGGGNDDIGLGIAVDRQGNAYVTGATRSTDFPTAQPIQRAFAGGNGAFATDAFVLKLDPTGSRLLYSTYLGGRGDDGARGIAIDTAGNAYLAGATSSPDFPVLGPMQSALRGGHRFGSDAFAAKINAAGNGLVYSTYLGGESDDAAGAIGVDAAGNAYLTGVTYSANFPLQNPVQQTHGGSADAFVAKLNPAGSALLNSTYLGGSSDEYATALVLNAAGEVHVTGFTGSTNFPLVRAAQLQFGSASGFGFDAFLTRYNSAGTALIYSTFLGGGGDEFAYALALDTQGNAYVTGDTTSTDFATPGALQPAAGGLADAFAAKLNAAGTAFEYRTYLGGSGEDSGAALAVDAAGTVYLAGTSGSVDSAATLGALQTSVRGLTDAWLLRIGPGAAPPAITSVSAASFSTSGGVAPDSIVSGFGVGLAAGTAVASGQPLPTSLGGTSVTVKDSSGAERAAPLFSVSGNQINYLMPPGTQPGLAAVTVTREGSAAVTGTARVNAVAPALFSADASGRGLAAGIALRVGPGGQQSTATLAECSGAPVRCTATPVAIAGENRQVYLLLFGTGIRGFTTTVRATVGGVEVSVSGAAAQSEFAGLDQVNLGPLPATLAGKGQVAVVLTVEGRTTNPVLVELQ